MEGWMEKLKELPRAFGSALVSAVASAVAVGYEWRTRTVFKLRSG